MGKKKSNATAVGRSLVRDRFGHGKLIRSQGANSFLHTSELNDGYDWGRLNLQSVTEQSNLDDFLTTAQLAGTEFTAEKLNITFVDPVKNTGLLTSDEKQKIAEAQEENRNLLCIPRRPPWDETTTRDELDLRERDAFLQWRRQLAQLQEVEHIVMTPYEKNLDFWRQLWRVIERSDIVVQIVDARNPLLFRSEDLEKYVKEVGDHKLNLLLINKADFLTDEQRETWADYFTFFGVKVAFWSALQETSVGKDEESIETETEQKSVTEEKKNGKDSLSSDVNDLEKDTEDKTCDIEKYSKVNDNAKNTVLVTEGRSQENVNDSDKTECDIPLAKMNVDAKEFNSDISKTDSAEVMDIDRVENSSSEVKETCRGDNSSGDGTDILNSPKVLTSAELVSLLRNIHKGPTVLDNVTTIGMVGYPNVGKSSTINAILKEKKVPVSATPGRTKHFQTLYLDSDLMLCDCPGLVFPSFVSTKAQLVISGILPVDQMREHIPPVSLVCDLIPRHILKLVYNINLPLPEECDDENIKPTAHELLNVYGCTRGFMTSKGLPDGPRSSRYILKDFVNGRLLYCHPPPGISEEDFQSAREPVVVKQRKRDKQDAKQSFGENKHVTSLDREFFRKPVCKAHSRGVHGVDEYIRGGCGPMASVSENSTSAVSSQSSLNEKPWKKHNNRRKKEKLRRIHSDMDIC
ncbi:large subunit GTPase 1 homolog [Gigantopelta aegis]|uniref:large subunit GTPase 1 homolog n=1 Tax=Gigantopelta aegis TaxID=1735272 RepID=UPI001B88ACC8|nr:large subunit GTPase 1 homolog [Gigantopelta aegis]